LLFDLGGKALSIIADFPCQKNQPFQIKMLKLICSKIKREVGYVQLENNPEWVCWISGQ
jgi:hypothetical protein